MIFHHEKPNSHTAELTTAYLKQDRTELDIIYLEYEDIPIKCPDSCPLDFLGFLDIETRSVRTLERIWKIAQGYGHESTWIL